MILGQSAAAAAVLAIDSKTIPHKIPYSVLKNVLLNEKQVLEL